MLRRKVLTPTDFAALVELEQRLLDFRQHYEQIATPFITWTFTRQGLAELMAKLNKERTAA